MSAPCGEKHGQVALSPRRNRQLTRTLKLLVLLNGNGLSLEQIADKLKVTTRTIRRDLDALQEAHIPVRKWLNDSYTRDKSMWSVRWSGR